MSNVPSTVAALRVVCHTPIDARHRHTGDCQQLVAGQLMGPMSGLAICREKSEYAYYLFGCDNDWQAITDTWHESIDTAKQQAEFEYEGVSKTWNESIQ